MVCVPEGLSPDQMVSAGRALRSTLLRFAGHVFASPEKKSKQTSSSELAYVCFLFTVLASGKHAISNDMEFSEQSR